MTHDWVYLAEVLAVVDGDTLRLRIDLGLRIAHDVTVRLYGIDTPEVYGVSKSSPEYAAGAEASAFARAWVETEGGRVMVRTARGTEKYGRWLAEVYSRDGSRCLNTALVEAGLARLYMVSTKGTI